MLAPNINRGMTYQTDENHTTNLQEYFVGAVDLVIFLNTCLLLHVFTSNLLKYLSNWAMKNS